jgi:hypothetical protein
MDATLITLASTLVTAVTLAYIETNIHELETRFDNGLTSAYYSDPFDVIEDPYPAQRLAALRCFVYLYQRNAVWVHLAAPMQSGKTGVMVTLSRLVMQHHSLLHVDPRRMFVFTGMSDNDWRTQTKGRFPTHIRPNIYHRSGIKRICESLRKLRGDGNLRNVLLFVDESHIATRKDNTPRTIYETLVELCPREQWAENNIRIVTVSATDPAKVITIRQEDGFPSRVVRLDTTGDYQSIETLVRDSRMRPILGNAHTETAINAMRTVITGYDSPRYHIIRAEHGKAAHTQTTLAAAFPEAAFVSYDSNSRNAARDEADSADLIDINTILETVPTRHTFIIIKNAFYAAKTLEDRYVGVLYDRQTDNDSAILQGLAGRTCGYGKSQATIVFTVQEAIERYLNTWRSLCLSIGDTNVAIDAEGYAAPARVMNLSLADDNTICVGRTEFNPGVAIDEPVPEAPAVREVSEFGPQVPVILSISDEEFATIPTTRGKPAKVESVLRILEQSHPALSAMLRGYTCNEITAPQNVGSVSYKNHIQVAVRCAAARDPCSVTISRDDKLAGSVWNCFIDKHQTPKRLCYVYVNPPN